MSRGGQCPAPRLHVELTILLAVAALAPPDVGVSVSVSSVGLDICVGDVSVSIVP